MPYTTGSQGAQASCAKYFMENALHTALTAVYTYVEEVVNGAVTVRVYKSLAANNFFGQDWFLTVKRATDAATTVTFGVTEQYNSTTHLCFNYAPSAASGLTPTAQFAVNDVGGKAPDNAALFGSTIGVATAGFQYWLSVTANRAVFASRVSTSDYATYVGLYDDLLPLAMSPFPLAVFRLYTGQGGLTQDCGGTTREPNTTTSAASNFHLTGLHAAYNANAYQYAGWNSPYIGIEFYTGKYWLQRMRVVGRWTGTIGMRGLFRDVWFVDSYLSSGVNGDTLAATIDGVPKTLVLLRDNTGNSFVDTAL